MKDYKIYKLFPSPVFSFKLKNYQELNMELESYILDLKKNIKMVKKNQTTEVGTLLFLIKKTITHPKNFL